MGKRRDILRHCTQIRTLIADNQYKTALGEIDTLPLEEIESIEDLYLFAAIYEKAERLDMTERVYYIIYNRTHSKHILYRLLRLVIRLGELEQAKELLLAYEVVGGMTLDTYELRYRLAVATGEPRSKLVEILENLKKEEYTEEWGYQLARLYELEGMREKCIQECKDLKLWFGEGKIVDAAMALKERCESKDWEPPRDETIPDPVEPDLEETFVYKEPEDGRDEAAEESKETPGTSETVETPEASEAVETPGTPEAIETPEPAEAIEEETAGTTEMAGEDYESVSEPVVVKKKVPTPAPEPRTVEALESLPDEEPEDVSSRGVRYYTLKRTIRNVRKNKGNAHFVFAGGEDRITLAVAKRITKELNHQGYFSAQNIVKITAEKLNEIDLSEKVEKLLGGCLLITSAPELNKKAVTDVLKVINEQEDRLVVMMAGAFDEMDCFLSIYPELAAKMKYKVRL